MKSSAKNVKLASVDDLFSTEESRADEHREKVVEIPLAQLHPFKNHPFKVKDDEAMADTAESIRQYGVLVPAIARPDTNGGYELIAGHRRHHAPGHLGRTVARITFFPVLSWRLLLVVHFFHTADLAFTLHAHESHPL